MILKTYKFNRKIIGYITGFNDKFRFCTGKPSDVSCISWKYNNFQDAEKTAKEYINNYKNI